MLDISTRTIDRYVKRWKLSYKKSANKVLILRNDVLELLGEFQKINQEPMSEVINDKKSIWPDLELETQVHEWNIVNAKAYKNMPDILSIFQEQQKIIDKKDSTILDMQRYIWELEFKLQNTIALPEHTEEKQKIYYEKKELEKDVKTLGSKLRKEKLKNVILVWIFFIIVIVVVFVVFLSK